MSKFESYANKYQSASDRESSRDCPFMTGCLVNVGVPSTDRQQVNAGARASPSWIGGRRRPTRMPLCVADPPAPVVTCRMMLKNKSRRRNADGS